jgi:3-dehydroquinate synthase
MNEIEFMRLKMGPYISRIIIDKKFRIPDLDPEKKKLFVFDKKTEALFAKNIDDYLVLPGGEENKSWKSVELIHKKAVKMELTRESIFIGIGGGLLGDMVAFAASTYMRGCGLVLVPTTLLAMVDAGIGGKTGINFMGFKNMVGSFFPAEGIYIFLSALKSLTEKDYRQGIAEAIKTAMLGDEELFKMLQNESEKIKNRDMNILENVVKRCIAVKGRIVEDDFKEKGKRAFLNLGHTYAHALESVTELKGISHGDAVAWGINCAMNLGLRLGITNHQYAQTVKEIIGLYKFRTKFPKTDPEKLFKAMIKDKKRLKTSFRLIVQKNLCQTSIEEVDKNIIMDSMQ